MVKLKSVFLRFIPAICVVALVVAMAAPVSAFENLVGLDFEDYVESTNVTADGKTFYVGLPTSYAQWGQYKTGTSETVKYGVQPISFILDYNVSYTINCNVLGGASNNLSTFLRVDNIPDGSNVSLSWSILSTLGAFETPDLYLTVMYFNAKGYQIGSSVSQLGKDTLNSRSHSFSLDIPDGAVGCSFQLSYRNIKNVSGSTGPEYWFSLDSLDLVIPVSNYYVQNQQSEKQTAMLKEIEKQLGEQGQTMGDILDQQEQTNGKLDDLNDKQDQTNEKLDDMIDHTPTPEKPSGSDKVDSMGDAEQNINDSVSGGYDEFGGVVDGAIENLVAYTNTFLAVSAVFNLFADISMIKTLLIISLAIGFVSFLLNLGMAHASNKARESARAERKSHKGE